MAAATGQDLHVVGHARDLRVEQLPVQRDASRGHVGEEGGANALVPFMGVGVRPQTVVVGRTAAAALAAAAPCAGRAGTGSACGTPAAAP